MGERESCKVIVIGSGFGGAVAAAHLAEAGVSVVLLERGPWRDTVPVRSMGINNRTPFPRGVKGALGFMRSLCSALTPGSGFTMNRRGLFEMHMGKGLNIMCSSSVGGGSHVYTGVNMPPPDPNYWDGITDELSREKMEPLYAKVLDRLGSRAPTVKDQLPNTLTERR